MHSFPEVLNINRLFLKLNRFICSSRFSPFITGNLTWHSIHEISEVPSSQDWLFLPVWSKCGDIYLWYMNAYLYMNAVASSSQCFIFNSRLRFLIDREMHGCGFSTKLRCQSSLGKKAAWTTMEVQESKRNQCDVVNVCVGNRWSCVCCWRGGHWPLLFLFLLLFATIMLNVVLIVLVFCNRMFNVIRTQNVEVTKRAWTK